ncbi:MAG TPA: biotin/lipoyl-containing protein [Candidatus Limnocylindrales bacterium]|nr:biotin/lipoyl-containing protein [Candidatus Limnocylindrales bacterium]
MTDKPDGTAGDDAAPAVQPVAAEAIVPGNAGDASLLGLIDRLGNLLERSDLTELEVEVGATALVLRKPTAIATAVTAAADVGGGVAAAPVPASTAAGPSGDAPRPSRPSITAPLTGIWYASPAPGSAPFVDVGREVAVGQVVGLIEAMKLFNEIKSDLAGRVVRVVSESGTLVKAKQPLIEVEPL